jgi:hypothetical protein
MSSLYKLLSDDVYVETQKIKPSKTAVVAAAAAANPREKWF